MALASGRLVVLWFNDPPRTCARWPAMAAP